MKFVQTKYLTIVIPSIAEILSLEKTLSNLIDVISQLPKNYISRVKILISNNNSGFNYEKIIKKFQKKVNITVIYKTTRLIPSAHFEKILENVDTDYVTFLAIGDKISEEFIIKSLDILEEGLFNFVIPNFNIIDDKDKIRKQVNIFNDTKKINIKDYLYGPFGFGIYSMARTDVLRKAFDNNYHDWFDYVVTGNLIKNSNGIYVNDIFRDYELTEKKYIIKSHHWMFNPVKILFYYFKIVKQNKMLISKHSFKFTLRVFKNYTKWIFQKI